MVSAAADVLDPNLEDSQCEPTAGGVELGEPPKPQPQIQTEHWQKFRKGDLADPHSIAGI